MLHVEYFGFDAFLGNVFEHDLTCDATLSGSESESGADCTGTDDSELCGLDW